MTVLREMRQERGLSMAKASIEMRVNYSQLSNVERRTMSASAPFREVVASYFGVDQDVLFDSEGLAV